MNINQVALIMSADSSSTCSILALYLMILFPMVSTEKLVNEQQAITPVIGSAV